ncbi:hypothetical protein MSG28_004552 [Choristoneura fumiferana]|uniref:Uncharacterized protein n=1 Tax=Choristoneura fumiferana TaxID=7141 RepID=A0ACC0K6Z9_CHOFU|nr:hypothetical protein MSG28_004552 [Choristoneura fumiferana]
MSKIVFKINGKQYEVDGNYGPDVSLNEFIRTVADLRGTKAMCHEGGCGACVVAIRAAAPPTNEMRTFAVNSCLVSVLSCHGWEVTTVEGIGNRTIGYHDIQSRLAKFNGTQCGYCTPGWVMNMYSLSKSKNDNLTMSEIENSFAGNICRCTGYRPIADAFKTFATDVDKKLLSKLCDLEDLSILKSCGVSCAKKCPHKKNNDQNLSKKENDDDWCELTKSDNNMIQINCKNNKWSKAFTLEDVFKAMKDDHDYKLIAGNTGQGYILDVNLILGAGMPLTEMMELFLELSKKNEDFSYLQQFYDHMDLVAHIPVRNIGTIGGNLCLKHVNNQFQSDLFLLFETVGAMVTVAEALDKKVAMSLPDFLSSDLKGKVLLNVRLPPLSHCCNLLENVSIVYGSIAPNFIHASKTEAALVGKNPFTNETLQLAVNTLFEEIHPEEAPPEPSAAYRRMLAVALYYKYRSGGDAIKRIISQGSQTFDTDKSVWPLNQPVPKLEALVQCSGEATFANDLPKQENEVFAAFVTANVVAGSVIDNFDASEALKVPGVIAFYSAKDIPGENCFTPANVPFMTAREEILCSGKVEFNGQPAGIIVANREKIANKAAKLVKINYAGINNNKPLLTIDDVLKSPEKNKRVVLSREVEPTEIGNDVRCIIQGEFKIESQYHYTMEPQTTVVKPTEDGIEVYSATQWLDLTNIAIAQCLKVPVNSVNVIVRRVGGAYGSKISRAAQIACACALVSHFLGTTCRFILPLQTNMRSVGKRLPTTCNFEAGVNLEGGIQHMKLSFYQDCGHIFNEVIAPITVEHVRNCYNAKRWKIEANSVATDTASNTWCRAPASTEGVAIIEHIMERIAFNLNKDSLQIRLANMRKGNAIPEMFDQLKRDSNFDQRQEEVKKFNEENRWRKRALNLLPIEVDVFYLGNYNAVISIYHGDGSVVVTHGGIEMGQGINTKAAQVCAYILGIPLEKVSVKPSTSFTSPNAIVTGGSIGSECVAFAVKKASEILMERFKPIKDKMEKYSWEELINQAYAANVDLQASYMMSPKDNIKPYNVQAVCALEVEVDILTGNHDVRRVDLLEDTGRSLSPEIDVAQLQHQKKLEMSKILFKINGKQYEADGKYGPDVSLNEFIRTVADLRGTKAMCHEGGCGACVVAIRAAAPPTNEMRTFAVNSCLVSILSCHGWEITTVEGIGNRTMGYHDIQTRLAKFNGTQCGYCTPGWIMNMYSLYNAKNGKLTTKEIENSFAGNLCRCTGYRPIADAFKTFASDADCNLVDKLTDLEDLGMFKPCGVNCTKKCPHKNKENDILLGKLNLNQDKDTPEDDWCVVEDSDNKLTVLEYGAQKWYKAFTLEHVFKIMAMCKEYKLIAGNTGQGVYHVESYPSNVIDIFSVAEIKGYVIDVNLILGAGMTLTDMMELFLDLSSRNEEFSYLKQFHEHMDLVAHIPVRNIMPRSQNAHAVVNAGFMFKFKRDTTIIEKVSMIFGSISASFIHASKTEALLIGKDLFTNETLQIAAKSLFDEILPEEAPPEPSAAYRRMLAVSLYYKAILYLCPEDKLDPKHRSGGTAIKRNTSKGTQMFDTDKSVWPLNQPVPKIEALVQCSGEANFANDLPSKVGEVYGAFVCADANSGSIISGFDATEAMKITGVVAFYTAQNIPGDNVFTPLNVPLIQATEEILCSKEVKFYGQPAAIIVANREKIANRAAKLVKVKYASINKNRPLLTPQDVLKSPERSKRVTNNKTVEPVDVGHDVKLVLKGELNLETQYHYYMEPQTCVVKPTEDGIEVYSATQWLDLTNVAVAQCLKVPANSVNVIVRRVGGSYGGKITRSVQIACAAAIVSHLQGKTCRFVVPLQTNIKIAGKRIPTHSNFEVGVNNEGEIQYLRNIFYQDNGCAPNETIGHLTLNHFLNCYDTKRWYIEANTSTEGVAMIENIIEIIAHNLGKDPMEIRAKNMAKGNNPIPELIDQLKQDSNYEARLKEIVGFNGNNRWRKRAMKIIPMTYELFYFGNYNSIVSVLHGDGSVVITHGGIEMGQGINTKVAQVAAYILGVSLDKVSIKPSTSFISPNTMTTGASIGSECVVFATMKACEILIKRFEPIREKMGKPSWEELVEKVFKAGIDLQASHMFSNNDGVKPYFIYGVVALELEVDILTGNHDVRRVDLLEDTGRSLSPEIDIGQIEGAFVMGLGYFTSEKTIYDPESGRLLTDRTWTYKPPGIKDIPADFRVYFKRNAGNPYGVLQSKATGEPALCLSSVVIHALREAVRSARLDAGYKDDWVHIADGKYGPDVSLNEFIRTVADLRGTKAMCHEGGCGACVVAIRAAAPPTNEMRTFAVNSCLVSILSCHGWEITTVEGIGNRTMGYHDIQTRLAKFNGTQCGYCTPGWIMNMYSLYNAKNGKLTTKEIENSFAGNLCRCTGYRPIADAFKTFASDADCNLVDKLTDLEDLGMFKPCGVNCTKKCPHKNKENDILLGKLNLNQDKDTPEDDWCVVEDSDNKLTVLEYGAQKWYKAFTLEHVFKIMAMCKEYKLIAGNTGQGVYHVESYPSNVIDIFSVAEIKGYVIDVNLILGAGMTLTDMMELFLDLSSRNEEFSYLKQFHEHMDLVAHIPVRNVNWNYWRKFVYEIMPRSQNAHAVVNAGFMFKFKRDTTIIEKVSLIFGSISASFIHASKTEALLIGKDLFTNETLQIAAKSLFDEILPEEAPPEPSAAYRRMLAVSLYYKAILYLCPEDKLDPKHRSGGTAIKRNTSKGTQMFDTDKSVWPLNQPVPKIEALVQCSGEANFANDLPSKVGEVYGAFVCADANSGSIISGFDATEAMKITGVVAFYTAQNIPGDNVFTPLNVPLIQATEEILCSKEVKFYGQPAAIIVANREKIANRAAKLVKVKYASINKNRPLLTPQDVLKSPERSKRVTNNKTVEPVDVGHDVKLVLKGELNLETQYHYYMEPQTCVVKPTEDASTEGVAMIENIIEIIAHNLGKDPMEIRAKNMAKGNNPIPELIDQLKQDSNYEARLKEIVGFNGNNRWRKRAMKIIPMTYELFYFGNYNSIVSVLHGDGSVVITHGGIEMGQGINTKVAQVAAYILGVSLDKVSIKPSTSFISPNTMTTGASIGKLEVDILTGNHDVRRVDLLEDTGRSLSPEIDIGQEMALSKKTDVRQMWEKIPFALDFKIYLFNYTNAAEVQKGAIPIVKEIGPYYFEEWKEKVEVEENDEDDTINYKKLDVFLFKPEQSGPGLTGEEIITMPNPFMVGMATVVHRDKPAMLNMINKAFAGIFDNPEDIFFRVKALDILFRGIIINCARTEFAPKAVCTALKKEANVMDVGQVIAVDGKPQQEIWRDHCNEYSGTDGTVFPPFLTEKDRLQSFSGDLCRSFKPWYQKKTSYRGIKTNRYIANIGDFANDPELQCFCDTPDTCPPKGLMDLTKCLGAPMFVSMPHFLDCDPSVQKNVKGLTPDANEHGIEIDFEPISGTPMEARQRIQFNMRLLKTDKLELFKDLPDTIAPLFWIEEGLALNKTFVNMLKHQLFWPKRAVGVLKWLLVSFGILGALGGAVFHFKGRVKAGI